MIGHASAKDTKRLGQFRAWCMRTPPANGPHVVVVVAVVVALVVVVIAGSSSSNSNSNSTSDSTSSSSIRQWPSDYCQRGSEI